MFKRNGQTVDITQDLVIGEGEEAITIPAGSLQDEATRQQYGIVDEPESHRADERFYWNGDLSTPRDLEEVKARMVAEVNGTANALLSQTAWYIERASDPTSGKPIPQDVLDSRKSIRDAADANEAAITAVEEIADLASFAPVWPQVSA